MQTDLFQIHTRENNRESQTILEYNIPHFKAQCMTAVNAMMRGEILTVRVAQLKYGIGDFRARIRDIRESELIIEGAVEKIKYHEKLCEGRYKAWYMDTNDITMNKILIEKLKQHESPKSNT